MNSKDQTEVSQGRGGPLRALERDILRELSKNPHASNREISEALGLTLSQVTTRIRRLEQDHIAHVLAVLDLKKTGQDTAFILVSVRGRPLEAFAADAVALSEVQTVSTLGGGNYDLMVLVRFRGTAHLDHLLNTRIAGIDGAGEVACHVVLNTHAYDQEFIAFTRRGLPSDINALLADLSRELSDDLVDVLDRRIIAELQVDGRRTSQSIAAAFDINPGTVRNRIRALEGKGLMRFVTVIDPRSVGIRTFAVVQIAAEASRLGAVIGALATMEAMPFLFSCAGPTPLLGMLMTSNTDAAREIVNTKIRAIPGVTWVNLLPLVENHKIDVRWGLVPEPSEGSGRRDLGGLFSLVALAGDTPASIKTQKQLASDAAAAD